jgi:hypothetical protein
LSVKALGCRPSAVDFTVAACSSQLAALLLDMNFRRTTWRHPAGDGKPQRPSCKLRRQAAIIRSPNHPIHQAHRFP